MIVPRYNEEGAVSGFGVALNSAKVAPNDELKTTYLTVVKEAECPIGNFHAQEASNFCARDYILNSRLCKGDTGSAFVILQRGIPVLVRNIQMCSPLGFPSSCFRFASHRANEHGWCALLCKQTSTQAILAKENSMQCYDISFRFIFRFRLALRHKFRKAVPAMMDIMPHHFCVFTRIWDGSKQSLVWHR